ncbi:MAG: Smr/MutS family protein [Myxococcota bacterium]
MSSAPTHTVSGKKKNKKSGFGSSLAEQLSGLDIEVREQREQREAAEQRERIAREQNAREAAKARYTSLKAEDVLVSDEELFEQTLEQLTPEDIYQGKYIGNPRQLPSALKAQTTPEPDAPQRSAQEQEEQRKIIAELREDTLFEKAVGLMDSVVDDGKYYKRKPKARSLATALGGDDEPAHPLGLITPSLPRQGEELHAPGALVPSQKGLLQRCKLHARTDAVPTLNLRRDVLEDAMRQLELFMHQSWKDDARFVRVIHGRGVRSEHSPVLKPAVLEWLEGPGLRYIRGYAPEMTQGGDYGSLVVALGRRRRREDP